MAAAPSWLLFAFCAQLPPWGWALSISDPAFIQDCVEAHNKFRAEVQPAASKMFKMTWDEALAKSAKAWGKKCTFKHNPNLRKKGAMHPSFYPVGENIHASTGSFNTKHAIKAWNDEMKNYNYGSNSCKQNADCRHYTQIVWETTYKVGCAVTKCPSGLKASRLKGAATIFVCNYVPAGNFAGKSPYASGSSCSACPRCSGKLCTDPNRDKLKRYPQWMPDFGSASISLHDQLNLLITFILIYTLQ